MNKDYPKEIIKKWYEALDQNHVQVAPKAGTILGTILSKYDISEKEPTRNIWDEYLTISGGDFHAWYEALSDKDRTDLEAARKQARVDSERHLLKG